MRSRLLAAVLLLVLGAVAYESFSAGRGRVRVTDDGIPPPPPSWP
jgi:hypothetical protein